MKGARIVFITGTDTGVGKTLLTALLLRHLRSGGCHALGMKPFCSGGRSDVDLIRAAQDSELTADEINPFYYPEPVAPLVSGRLHGTLVSLEKATRAVRSLAKRCDCLVVEGSGGLLVPLGEGYTVRELIAQLQCEIVVVARNRLGTINHTLLTIESLRGWSRHSEQVNKRSVVRGSRAGAKAVLMATARRDVSSRSNSEILSECLGAVPLIDFPFLGRLAAERNDWLNRKAKKFAGILEKIVER